MLPNFARQTVTRLRPGTKTIRGSEVPDWDHVESLEISGCSVQPAATDLSQDGRVLGILDGMTAYMPPGSDVKEGDWFKSSVDWAVANGITNGYGEGTFRPNVNCNRAMMAAFLRKAAAIGES